MEFCGNTDMKFGCFVLRYGVKCRAKKSMEAEKVKATPPSCLVEFECYPNSTCRTATGGQREATCNVET